MSSNSGVYVISYLALSCSEANVQWQTVMNNPVVPYTMLQPTSCQQVTRKNVTAPLQHQMIPPIHNDPSEDDSSQQSQRMTSTSEEEEETNITASDKVY